MGFNKRFIRRDGILRSWKNGGIEGLHTYFSADALFINEDCRDLVKLYDSRDFDSLEKLIAEELSKAGE
jgi:hypothetical protein